MSNGENSTNNMHGAQTRTVSRKHGAKSGSVVFHVRSESWKENEIGWSQGWSMTILSYIGSGFLLHNKHIEDTDLIDSTISVVRLAY